MKENNTEKRMCGRFGLSKFWVTIMGGRYNVVIRVHQSEMSIADTTGVRI
jgi:hypothetical protein